MAPNPLPTRRRVKSLSGQCLAGGEHPRQRLAARRMTSMPGGRPTSSTWPSSTATDTRAPPMGTWSTRSRRSQGGRAGSIQSSPRWTHGSNRRSTRREVHGRRCGPCLRRAGGWIRHRTGELGSGETAQQLRKATVVGGGGVEDGGRHPLGGLNQPVTHEAAGDDGVVVGPDRAVVIAERVVGAHRRRQRPDARAADHLGGQEMLGHRS